MCRCRFSGLQKPVAYIGVYASDRVCRAFIDSRVPVRVSLQPAVAVERERQVGGPFEVAVGDVDRIEGELESLALCPSYVGRYG